ncbi:LysR family transcriptional regulator [Staphylococcus epidermidis]|uniref:LysR family transcriptional regulator n=1 Tax=Staphylococcus epidermidis TaxID=1282 RepID=UPI000F8766A5|nr:LysR family transcriptional regulator [Staphylococcus epidermidis]MBE7320092.1 LysR family transcriptional regulator [Staphylococcus epidermidis]RUN12595.1 LysR family transcriptional regulator [Staphylococcus epidermidis]TIC98528.1 putative HTH-type transcriptional regulator BenM [Staphylococcus epidermidis VCU112]
MNFNDLIIFKNVYEEKSINKAAIKLMYAQSNISQRISKIEEELGVNLLLRTNKGIDTTEFGEDFYIYCKKVLKDTNSIKNRFKNKNTSILCSELLFNYLSENEEISINDKNISIVSSKNIEKSIEMNHYDKVISFTKLNKPMFSLNNISSIDVIFYINTLSDTKLPLLINKDELCPIRQLSLKYKNTSRQIIEIDSLASIINLVELGKGIALLPSIFENKRNLLRLTPEIYKINYYSYNNISSYYN